ncbi:hypothetical protein OG788_40105 [Streptomyces sp. NBC_00647]|uniref:hypothetical protein n=1 Tax=Streptomyces sp. NBC_00647 TaxID=2975796 RepID=UPI0032464C97
MSILFAAPDTVVIEGLHDNMALYNARSGHMWDLYIAGYYAYGGNEYDPDGFPIREATGRDAGSHRLGVGQGTDWWFGPQRFVQLSNTVAAAHSECLERVPVLRGRRTPWKYSGSPEIVNLWVSDAAPDWESLTAHEVGHQGPSALSAVVESHSDWRTDPLPPGYGPGTRAFAAADVLHVDALRRALSWAVAGAAGAALSEGATHLVNGLTKMF